MDRTDAAMFRVQIPRCPHTALTMPECSCPHCLRGMLTSVGFLPPAPAATEVVTEATGRFTPSADPLVEQAGDAAQAV